jgi:hypothetical protein
MNRRKDFFVRKIKSIDKTTLKKRVAARPANPQPAPAQPQPGNETFVRFERIHLRSFRQCRGTAAKLLKALVNQQLSPDVIKAAVLLLDRALAANNSILLQQRLESISHLLQMEPQDFDEPDLPDETLESGEGSEED